MTPAARVDAAIGLLDTILAGAPAEQVLTTWARQNRYAGSGDRAAVRDHVYGALRCRRSYAALGGADSGRGLMLGALRAAGHDPDDMFTGVGYAPAPLAPDEAPGIALDDLPGAVRRDVPDWLVAPLQAALGTDYDAIMERMRHRASVFLRVNRGRARVADAVRVLAEDGIETRPGPLAETALEVTGNPRKIKGSHAYLDGIVELQDAASQAVAETVPLVPGARVLDYCAGGGGKALALAARGADVSAHDVEPRRLTDLSQRAGRAGVRIPVLETGAVPAAAPFDVVVADVPCSGSGTWARNPQAKWTLTPERLTELCQAQAGILDTVQAFVAPGGVLAYVTCSLLDAENAAQVGAFLDRHPGWHLTETRRYTPLEGGDGLFLGLLTR